MVNGDITKKDSARKMALVEYIEWDSYNRWINYDKHLQQKERNRK